LPVAGLLAPAPVSAGECNDAFCTPGITGEVVLGAPCQDDVVGPAGVLRLAAAL
jgi:hypothetical protein